MVFQTSSMMRLTLARSVVAAAVLALFFEASGAEAADCATFVADLNYPDGSQVSPGETINKGWRLRNCGDTTWSGFTAVRVGGSFGPASFSVPTVSPGNTVDLFTNVTVPTTAGTHRATYRIQGPRGAFGDPFWVEVNVVASSNDCAAFVLDLNYPDGSQVSPGETINKGWRLRNCGDTWSGFTAVRVGGSFGPASFSVPTVSTGNTVDLFTNVTVPTTAGTHRATYRIQGPRGAFGDPFWVEVNVVASSNDCAAFLLDLNYPDGSQVSPGETINKGWRLRNCGDTWSGFTAVRVGGSFGPASFSVPTVSTGNTVDLFTNVTVPTTAGTHRATYRIQGPRGAFGDPFWVEVNVVASSNDCAAFLLDLNYPDGSQVSPGETINKGWRLRNCGDTWSGFTAVRVGGSFGPASFSVPTVSTGNTVDLFTNVTVPTTAGTHRATYRIQGPRGAFGDPFWVEVNVVASSNDCAAFLLDLNYPDGSQVSPGETINKGWRLRNCGDTWSGFTAVRVGGSFGPASFSVPTVSTGNTVDLFTNVTVPTTAGTHRATYRIQGPRGAFGDPFWVEVNVVASSNDCAAFLLDLNYPDGSQVSPGETINKGWRLRNCGDTWSGFTAVRVGGSFGPASFSVPAVSTGNTVDLFTNVTVPTTAGTHRATYRIQGPQGPFGDAFWVEVSVSGTTPPGDVALLAPVSRGQTLVVVHGYNDPIPGEPCVIGGGGADHCSNQKYGLDLNPSRQAELEILAPLPGRIAWISGDCMGIRTRDDLNLNVCHFGRFDLGVGDEVSRGAVLGARSTSWIHLSLDDRYRDSSRPPVPFNGTHRIEGLSFDPQADTVRNQHAGASFTSTNAALAGSGDCSRLVADLNFPDGTAVSPGQSIRKGWRLENCGDTSWTGFTAVKTSGVFGPATFEVPETAPGATTDVFVNFTAPTVPGTHRATYRLLGSRGQFGASFWIEIVVTGSANH